MLELVVCLVVCVCLCLLVFACVCLCIAGVDNVVAISSKGCERVMQLRWTEGNFKMVAWGGVETRFGKIPFEHAVSSLD